MKTWIDTALASFDDHNDALATQTRGLLTRIVPTDPLHARFINTLSLLEHLGSHKIMATQHSAQVEQATLRHVAEEAHHAYFLKHQAEKVATKPLAYSAPELLAPAAARMYFQRLEGSIKRLLASRANSSTVYLYMSLIVEFRALWFYKLYQRVLKAADHGLSLKRLLGEEENHLNEMAQRLNENGEFDAARTTRCLETERKLYARLLRAMQDALATA